MKFDVATIEAIFSIANAGISLYERIRDAAVGAPGGELTAEQIKIIVETQYIPKQDELDAKFAALDEEELTEDGEDGDDGSDQ